MAPIIMLIISDYFLSQLYNGQLIIKMIKAVNPQQK